MDLKLRDERFPTFHFVTVFFPLVLGRPLVFVWVCVLRQRPLGLKLPIIINIGHNSFISNNLYAVFGKFSLLIDKYIQYICTYLCIWMLLIWSVRIKQLGKWINLRNIKFALLLKHICYESDYTLYVHAYNANNTE